MFSERLVLVTAEALLRLLVDLLNRWWLIVRQVSLQLWRAIWQWAVERASQLLTHIASTSPQRCRDEIWIPMNLNRSRLRRELVKLFGPSLGAGQMYLVVTVNPDLEAQAHQAWVRSSVLSVDPPGLSRHLYVVNADPEPLSDPLPPLQSQQQQQEEEDEEGEMQKHEPGPSQSEPAGEIDLSTAFSCPASEITVPIVDGKSAAMRIRDSSELHIWRPLSQALAASFLEMSLQPDELASSTPTLVNADGQILCNEDTAANDGQIG